MSDQRDAGQRVDVGETSAIHPSAIHPSAAVNEADEGAAVPRRRPGEPHPYMLQRNPPNLWILAALTAISLVVTALVLALTVLL